MKNNPKKKQRLNVGSELVRRLKDFNGFSRQRTMSLRGSRAARFGCSSSRSDTPEPT